MGLQSNPYVPLVPTRRSTIRVSRREMLIGGAAAAAGALLAPSPTTAVSLGTGPDWLHQATQFFDFIALTDQDEGGPPRPGWVRKWVRPIRVRVRGDAPAALHGEIEAALAPLSRWTGLPIGMVRAADKAEVTIEIKPHAELVRRFGPDGNVCACETYGWSGRLHTGYIEISARHTDCLRHELMHALGFDNHWSGQGQGQGDTVRSALALRHSPYRAAGFSSWDRLAISTLYDPRLKPRMPRRVALPIAREILASLRNG